MAFPVSAEAFLEGQFGSQLDLPRCSGGLIHLSCAVDAQGVIVDRCLKVGVIEDVEEFRAELRVKPFIDRDILEQRKVDIDRLRAIQRVPPVVP